MNILFISADYIGAIVLSTFIIIELMVSSGEPRSERLLRLLRMLVPSYRPAIDKTSLNGLTALNFIFCASVAIRCLGGSSLNLYTKNAMTFNKKKAGRYFE